MSLQVLVLGGTSFVGRTIVADLLDRGHTPTLFSRGRTNPGVFPDVEHRTGDRDTGDYGSLAGGHWDAVVDVSAYVPRAVDQALDALGDEVGRYLFISTGSVYDRAAAPEQGLREDCPRLAPLRDTEQVTDQSYGRLKVACEDDVVARLGARGTIVRPGVVAGPHDPTDRFTYWVRRAARGGRVAVAGELEQPVQVVDSRDLARLVVRLLEDDRTGIYNAVGPAEPTSLGGLLRACAQAAGTVVEPVVVPATTELPLVLPDRSWWPLFRRSAAAAHAAGMPATPLSSTAADVLAWDRERGLPPLAVGWTEEQEDRALAGIPGA